MTYSFQLDFNELSESLQAEKIREYIESGFESGGFEGETLDEAEASESNQDKARLMIEARFPMYF